MKGKTMFHSRIARWSAAAVLAAAGALAMTPASHAASDISFRTPIHGGLLLNASHWGGEGSKAGTLAFGGVVNDPIDVWSPSNASVASDFTKVDVSFGVHTNACTAGNGCFLIEYTPGGNSTGLCVSTVTDVVGAFARLRSCASDLQDGTKGHGVNQWQDFAETNGGDNLSQLQAVLETDQLVLNDKAYGSNGSQVISWTSTSGTGSENQLWEEVNPAL